MLVTWGWTTNPESTCRLVFSRHDFECTGHGLMCTRTYAGDLRLNYWPRKYIYVSVFTSWFWEYTSWFHVYTYLRWLIRGCTSASQGCWFSKSTYALECPHYVLEGIPQVTIWVCSCPILASTRQAYYASLWTLLLFMKHEQGHKRLTKLYNI